MLTEESYTAQSVLTHPVSSYVCSYPEDRRHHHKLPLLQWPGTLIASLSSPTTQPARMGISNLPLSLLRLALLALPILPTLAVHEGGTTLLLSTFEAGTAQGLSPRASAGLGYGRLEGDTVVAAPNIRLRLWLSWSGLSGPITVSHFHGPAWIGQAGPVVANVPLPPRADGRVERLELDVSPATWALMVQGRTYLNLHTAKYPDGEIRAHVCFSNCGLVGLFGEAERPNPVSTQAYGIAQVSIALNTNVVTVNRLLTFNFAPGNDPVGAHVHAGGPNAAGPILCPIAPPGGPAEAVPCAPSTGGTFTVPQLGA